MEKALYLIPVPIGETPIEQVLPTYNKTIILEIKHFIVENIRTARRFLKKVEKTIDIDELTFYPLNKNTSSTEIRSYLNPLKEGYSIGVLSEAGCPAIADPGANIVAIAQKENFKVIPLVGPSSILMSLMASGFNGQSFAFHGYLPIETKQREQAINKLENRSYNEDQTQLFIETPYRNDKMLQELIKHCRPNTQLCIAANISCKDEFIKTQSIQKWGNSQFKIGKRPCLFLIYKG